MFRRYHDASQLERLSLGRYPTAVERLDALASGGSQLWVKHDDATHPVYGGNKVRKLERLLAAALARGARRIVTVGAVGSHHVLATTYFGRGLGLEVDAVLVPQPRTAHVVETLRAGLGLGLHAIPAESRRRAVALVATRLARGGRRTHFIPLGGSSALGAMGYVDAARELAVQVRAGVLPEPDVCVVALGSGGTAAGLAAGFAAEGMKTRVVGVCVADPAWWVRRLAAGLAVACARRAGTPPSAALSRLSFDARFLGAGYGVRTAAGEEASRAARRAAPGLELDPTYTEKAFAGALACARESAPGMPEGRPERVVLYWHTLSSAPLGPLLADAPPEASVDARLRRLCTLARGKAPS